MPLPKVPQIRQVQTPLVALVVFGEDVLEVLRLEAPLIVVRHAVAAMFVLIHARGVDAKEGVGQPARHGRVGEVAVDEDGGDEGEEDVPAEGAAAGVGVLRPDDAVVVLVPVFDVLDHDLQSGVCKRLFGTSSPRRRDGESGAYGLVLVVARVVPLLGAVRTLGRGGNGRSGGAGVVETAVFAGDVRFALQRDRLLSDGGAVGLLVGVVVDGVADQVVVHICVGVVGPVDDDGTGVALVVAHPVEGAVWRQKVYVEESRRWGLGRVCFEQRYWAA